MCYLIDNISLAKDVPIYLDAIKVRIIQDLRRININQLSNYKIRCKPIKDSED